MSEQSGHTAENDAARCRHCGKQPEIDGDHSCPCLHPDETCPDHTPSGETPEIDAVISKLADERGRRGISMREVARSSGVSPSCVHSWEHGTRAPSLNNLRAWAASLGYDLILTPTFRSTGWPRVGPNQHTRGDCRCGQWHGSDEFL